MVDVGGYYKFRDPGFQLLFCYGHTVIGQTENYAYLGLYWTWGKKKADAGRLPLSNRDFTQLHFAGATEET